MTSTEFAREYWRSTNAHLPEGDANKFATEMLDPRRAEEALDLVAAKVGFGLEGRRLLEIGSGVGTVLRVARERGIDAWGIEPDFLGCRAGRANLREHQVRQAITCAIGELLPFADSTFDVVCSFQVLGINIHLGEPGVFSVKLVAKRRIHAGVFVLIGLCDINV